MQLAPLPIHITLMHEDEPGGIQEDDVLSSLDRIHWRLKDKDNVVFFAVIVWEDGQRFRARFGLSRKQFHITLAHSSADVQIGDKGFNSLGLAGLDDERWSSLLKIAKDIIKVAEMSDLLGKCRFAREQARNG